MARGPLRKAAWAAAAAAAAAALLIIWIRQQSPDLRERSADSALTVSLAERLAPEPEPMNLLILGVDAGETRTDIILLAHWEPAANQVSLVSLPRDSLVPIPCPAEVISCISPDKLGHAHAYGEVIGKGPELAVQTVEQFLGVHVDHYVRIHFDGFREVVDTVGGITLEVEPTMATGLGLAAGPQRLNGQQALAYVRFRSDGEGDFGRQRRTQLFLKELAAQVCNSFSQEDLPGLALHLLGKVETDLDRTTVLSALRYWLEDGEMPTFQGTSLPGSPHWERDLWFWVVDEPAAADVVEAYITRPDVADALASPVEEAFAPQAP